VYSSYSLTLKEQHIYAAKRMGIESRSVNMKITFVQGSIITTLRGTRTYELSNHLDNALVMISDKKIGVSGNGVTVDYYTADVVSANDYYAFGMIEPGRTFNGGSYRYGFNGKENDNEVKGAGDQLDYGSRIYDPRVGKFLSVDPLSSTFPFYSPYHFSGNNPIRNIDMDGAEPEDYYRHWQWQQPYNLSTGKKEGHSDLTVTVDDPKLGKIDAGIVYDKWTQKLWVVAQDEQGAWYYLRNDNGNTSEITVHPNKTRGENVVKGGHFAPFETQDHIQARLGAESADMLGEGVFLLTIGIVGWEAGLFSIGEASLAERGANAASDFTVQIVQNKFHISKVNWSSTAGAFIFANPFKAAATGALFQFSIEDVKNKQNHTVFGDKTLLNAAFETGVTGSLNHLAGLGINKIPIWSRGLNVGSSAAKFKDVFFYANHANFYSAVTLFIKEKVVEGNEKKEEKKEGDKAENKGEEKKE
jgi:RHS repeat-associated protein